MGVTHKTKEDELRKAIEEIIITDDYSYGVQMKTIDKMENLITADRKRVALEARIDELEQLIPEPVAEMVSIDYEDELKRTYDDIHNRIAEFKAQQEKTNDQL